MAQLQALPFAAELHKAALELDGTDLSVFSSLKEYFVNGTVTYDPTTKKLGFEIRVPALQSTFTGTVENVSATAAPSTKISGTISCMKDPSPGTQLFTVNASSAMLYLTFGVADKWLVASPVDGLTGGPYQGTGGEWV